MTIGQDYFRGNYYNQANTEFSGIKVYDTALTASEVKTLYDMGRCSNAIIQPVHINTDLHMEGNIRLGVGGSEEVGMIRYNPSNYRFEGRNGDDEWTFLSDALGLYDFTPNPFTFTNAGIYGRTGPTLTQLTSHADYSISGGGWRNNATYLNVSTFQGIQEWTVPRTRTYSISAYGAGSRATNQGGYGARINGTCALTKGEVIRILVGQTCVNATNHSDHGGAGGTFVVRHPFNTNASIIVIAGGGGGGHPMAGTHVGGNASLTTSGNNGTLSVLQTSQGEFGVGGTNGNAGLNGSSNNQGAGFFTGSGTGLAASFITGGIGGRYTASGSGGDGGFGGGGRHGTSHGGGGGGYSGGGGGLYTPYVGGGGGSYKAASFTVTSEDNTVHDGPGSVKITQL